MKALKVRFSQADRMENMLLEFSARSELIILSPLKVISYITL